MSGDKKDKKSSELFYWVTESVSFIGDIKKIRKKYDIPSNGFDGVNEIGKWREEHRGQLVNYMLNKNRKTAEKLIAERDFEVSLIRLLNKYELPVTLLYMLEEYLLSNNTKVTSTRYSFPCSIEKSIWKNTPISEEELWDEAGLTYTKLLIHEQATKSDVKKFIDLNWKRIQSNSKRPGQKTNRIRPTSNKERDKQIYELYYLKDLDVSAEAGGYKREKAVSKIIKEKFNVDMDWMTIRKIAHRQKTKRNR